MNDTCYINISGKEPFWLRWLGRLHWLWSGRVESDMIKRFRRKYDRVNIYTRTARLHPEQLRQLGELIRIYLLEHGYEEARYGILWGSSLQYTSSPRPVTPAPSEEEEQPEEIKIDFQWPQVPPGLAG